MALAAAQVIDALATRLANVTATGGRVYTSRTWPLAEADLPAWRIYASTEDVTQAGLSDRTGLHMLVVDAVAYCRATADLDDTMNALASAGLQALFAGTVPYGLQLGEIDRQVAGEGEGAMGALTLRLRAEFYARPDAPETILSS